MGGSHYCFWFSGPVCPILINVFETLSRKISEIPYLCLSALLTTSYFLWLCMQSDKASQWDSQPIKTVSFGFCHSRVFYLVSASLNWFPFSNLVPTSFSVDFWKPHVWLGTVWTFCLVTSQVILASQQYTLYHDYASNNVQFLTWIILFGAKKTVGLKLEDEADRHRFSGLREIKCKEKQSLRFLDIGSITERYKQIEW